MSDYAVVLTARVLTVAWDHYTNNYVESNTEFIASLGKIQRLCEVSEGCRELYGNSGN